MPQTHRTALMSTPISVSFWRIISPFCSRVWVKDLSPLNECGTLQILSQKHGTGLPTDLVRAL